MLLAQAIDNLPANYWKYFCMGLLVLLGAALAIGTLIYMFRSPPPPARASDDPPLKREVVSKRYNHDAIEQRFGSIETTLEGHEAELDFHDKEMQRMREEAGKINTTIMVSLARLETHFGLKEKREP